MSIENNNYMAKVAMNKSVLKEFHNSRSSERLVYLNDGDEFQICLFNPEVFTVGAEISINGETESGLIVVRPGERLWIERPLGKQKKYKFETYEVEDSEATEKATKHNGEIIVSFYREMPCTRRYYEPRYPISTGTFTTLVANGTTSASATYYSDSVSSFSMNSNANESSIDSNKTAINCSATLCSVSAPEVATIETGRITTGEHSDQKFRDVDIEFEYTPYKCESIKLLPMSRKPYTSSDLQKVYCTECGRKLNPKFKYCPYCGTKCLFYEE